MARIARQVMRWFKHFSDASDDEFISWIEEEFGWEGYGRWWKLLEAIAQQMDNTGKCSASFPWTKWQTILKGKRNKLETFLSCLQDKQKINLKQTRNILEISCPKLLELRDEYTRKSGHTPDSRQDKVAPDIRHKKEEEDKERKDITNVISKSSLKTCSDDFELFWKAYPKTPCSKKVALASYNKAIKGGATHADIIRGVVAYSAYLARMTNPPNTCHASTFLNQSRWEIDYSSHMDKQGLKTYGKQNAYRNASESASEINRRRMEESEIRGNASRSEHDNGHAGAMLLLPEVVW